MLTYLRVRWLHDHAAEPVLLLSELNDDRWEVRKIEVFSDATQGYASESESDGRSFLGKLPVPSLEEIAADPEFEPALITASEFEAAWANRAGKFAD